jgi:hypothetical protein
MVLLATKCRSCSTANPRLPRTVETSARDTSELDRAMDGVMSPNGPADEEDGSIHAHHLGTLFFRDLRRQNDQEARPIFNDLRVCRSQILV